MGVFDGVHRGHQLLIDRAVAQARRRGLPSVVVTFEPHPAEVVGSGACPPELTPMDRRGDLIAERGVDVLCVLDFTLEMAAMSAEDFVQQVLVEALGAADVIVGENFTFGHKAAGNVDLLATLSPKSGFELEAVALVGRSEARVESTEVVAAEPTVLEEAAADLGPVLSSTAIRRHLGAGNVAWAAEGLTRLHRLAGVVTHGFGRGAGLGFPTANIAVTQNACLPADGIYACWFTELSSVDGGKRIPAAVSIGTNPTFDGTTRTIEAHLLEEAAGGHELYGRSVALDFVAYLREMVAFSGPDDLARQMHRDVAETRELLTSSE